MTDLTPNHDDHHGDQGRQLVLGQILRATVLAAAGETDGRFDLVESRRPPGAMTPLHLHRRYEERFWVVSGELAVWAGDTHRVLRSGDYLNVPIGVPHTVRAGDHGCHTLTISSPAGFAELVARVGTPAALADDLTELDVELLARVSDELGDVLLGGPGVLPAGARGTARPPTGEDREIVLGADLRATILATGAETEGRLDLSDTHLSPGATTPLHLHRRYTERFWVVSGSMTVWAGADTLELRAGDHALVPIGVPHAVRAGVEGCHALHISSPAGFAELVQRAGSPAGVAAEFDPDRFTAIAAELGDEVLGPPGTLAADLTGPGRVS